MKNIHINICFFLISLNFFTARSQTNYIQNEFRSPLQIPLVLAGTFGELRSNHFHSGIDIKTQGKEGLPVIAIADGYISRIKIRPGGYGKALYLTHENGYTSVYAHLRNFSDSIDDYILKKQYENRMYSINLFPDQDNFLFKQGDTIAWSGNSGSSNAPHLHFEIRDTFSQEVINPLLFGFMAKDTTPPVIKNIFVYPLNAYSNINGLNDTLRLPVKLHPEKKNYIHKNSFSVQGEIGFGIEVYDLLDNATNKNGVFEIELNIDSILVYKHRMDRFSFSHTRYINSFIDFHGKKLYGYKSQKSFLDPNNKLNIYSNLKNEGRLIFDCNKDHIATYIISDIAGNFSKIDINFTSDSSLSMNNVIPMHPLFSFDQENLFKRNHIELLFPKNSFYKDLDFSYFLDSSDNQFICDIHHIHNDHTPIHNSFDISINIPNLAESLKSKSVICSLDNNQKLSCLSSKWNEGFLRAKSRNFGKFTAIVDTMPPKINIISFSYDLTLAKEISFFIKDDYSGIESYDAYVDGEWILLSYDLKNNTITHSFDGHIRSGIHTLEIVLYDKVYNEKRLKLEFVR